jgi:hypothetical protein
LWLHALRSRTYGKETFALKTKSESLFLVSQRGQTVWEELRVIMPGYLHISVTEPLAMHNPRALPQQSISMYTNIDDLETYIAHEEKQRGTSYLWAIDLPASERRPVMRDLALMGITAGALFPGLDGACQQLKERFFDL